MARSVASNSTPMVTNPIYETEGAIYEEIPGPRPNRAQGQLLEREQVAADRSDLAASGKVSSIIIEQS